MMFVCSFAGFGRAARSYARAWAEADRLMAAPIRPTSDLCPQRSDLLTLAEGQAPPVRVATRISACWTSESWSASFVLELSAPLGRLSVLSDS